MKTLFVGLIAMALLSVGCAALGGIAVDSCEAALGGSKAAALCDTIKKAVAEKVEAAEEAEAVEEVEAVE